MTTLLNQDNIISAVARVSLRTQKSAKSGQDYTILTLRFKNGLEIDYFVDKKDIFGLKTPSQESLKANKWNQF